MKINLNYYNNMIFNQKKLILRNKYHNYIPPVSSIQTFYNTKDLFLSHDSSKHLYDSSICSCPNKKKVNFSKSSENIMKKKIFTNVGEVKTKNIYDSEKLNLIQKILKKEKQLKINKKKIQNSIEIKHNEFKEKEELKKLKLKFHLIITRNNYPLCNIYEKQNKNFNYKFMEFVNSTRYLNNKSKFQENFHFNKNDLSKGHDPFEQIVDLSKLYNVDDIFNNLDKNEKNIISFDPNYFIKDKKYHKSINLLKSKYLFMTLNEEEKSLKKKKISKYKSLKKNKSQNNLINQKNKNDKYLSKREKIENNINKELNKIFTAKLKKNKSLDNIFEKEINLMNKKILLINKENIDNIFYEKKIQDKYFFLKEKNKREYLIKRNKNRIDKEEILRKNNNKVRKKKSDFNYFVNKYIMKFNDILITQRKSKSVNSNNK